MNDGIAKSLCSLSYISVDDIASVLHLGRGALLAKMDVQSAYRNVPAHPDDRILLGMQWESQLFIDTALPFGLRLAPKIFTAVADDLEWVAKHKGVRFLEHYLDDFIVVGAPGSEECAAGLEVLLETCKQLGMPIAAQKVEGPATCVTFLGIEVDTGAMVLCLPQDKLHCLKSKVAEWQSHRSCRKEEVEALIGHLSHACKVVRPQRRFLRRMIELLAVAKKHHHHIRLSSTFRADLEWWHAFLSPWNGGSMLMKQKEETPDFQIWTDASGSWGCAAVWESEWLQVDWQQLPEFGEAPIAAKEMLPIITAVAVWGNQWVGKVIECRCDNKAVVMVIRHGYTKEKHMAHLLQCLLFIEARLNVTLVATHVPGAENPVADALSRNRLMEFLL